MNLYDVVIKKGYSNDQVELKLLAVDIEKASKDAKRFGKATYVNPEVLSIEKVCTINVFYKS